MELKVTARLVYGDGTTSDFDVLNDTSIALWNTIIGAGDAGKPSDRTKIVFRGNLDNLNVIVFNGKRKVADQRLQGSGGEFEILVNDTGCEEVRVVVTKGKKEVYLGSIPFRCGE